MQCAICEKEFIRCGNNPYPVKQEGRCCDECYKIVQHAIRKNRIPQGRKMPPMSMRTR